MLKLKLLQHIPFIVVFAQEKGFYSSYRVENPKYCTAYELQVRCACETSLASNWSESHRIPALEMGEASLKKCCYMLIHYKWTYR